MYGGTKRFLWALLAALALVVCVTPGAVAQTAMPEGIPDFSQDGSRPSAQTVQSGPWSSPSTWQGGVVPTSNHIVRILQPHTVTIQNESAAAYTVSVDGKLAFDPGVNTRLYVTNLQIMAGSMGMGTPGVLEVGTVANPIPAGITAEIVIANNPLGGSVADPDQFGTGVTVLGKVSMHGGLKTPTFVRLAAEPRAGQSTLTLAEAVSGWAPGDRLILPDTRHMRFDELNEPSWTNNDQPMGRAHRLGDFGRRQDDHAPELAALRPPRRARPEKCAGVPAARRQHHAQRRHPLRESGGHARTHARDAHGGRRHPLRAVQGISGRN